MEPAFVGPSAIDSAASAADLTVQNQTPTTAAVGSDQILCETATASLSVMRLRLEQDYSLVSGFRRLIHRQFKLHWRTL
jgi:hypothetical protein